jgi:hypothetical protein
MKKICLESAKRKYTQQRHEGTYHSLWYRQNWQAEWLRFAAKDGKKKFTFKEMPFHRRKLAINMANSDTHQVGDVPVGEQDFSLAHDGKGATDQNSKTVIRRRSK